MKAIKGFSIECAQAMQKACGMESDSTFIDRAQQCDFWGLYVDGQPVGGILVEVENGRPSLHVGSLSKGSGFAVRRVVTEAMQTYKRLFAAIQRPNDAVERLAKGLGFSPLVQRRDWIVYGRSK